jgi:uncharacterized membrane protein YjjP (DUF1212 family)
MTPDGPDVAAAGTRDEVRFILAIARALHTAGTTAQRLEDSLDVLAHRLGLANPQFFSTPTSIMASFGPDERQQVHLLRLELAGPNIGKLSRLDRVVAGVLAGRLTPIAALAQVEEIAHEPSRYGSLLTIAAFGLASAGIARFLGGGGAEVAAGGVLGLFTGALEAAAEHSPGLARVYEPLAAFVAAFCAASLSALVHPFAVYTATLAGIIVLLPGLLLTNAIRELAQRHLASGTARLFGAVVTLLSLVFGVALGDRLAGALFGTVASVAPLPLPAWTSVASVIATGLSFVVILKAEPSDTFWIIGAGAVTYLAGRVFARHVGPELGLFLAALLAGIGAAIWGRFQDRPQQVVLVPGILMLVPGSIGFKSLSNLLERDVISGVQTAFTMILAATALSAGLLVAGLIAPPRRRAKGAGAAIP